MLTLATPISTARGILQDPDATRYSDADLLQYANDALDVMVGIVPQLFYQDIEHACATDKAEQALSFGSYRALVDVLRVKNGPAVLPGDRATLDAFMPGWRSSTSAAAQNWMPVGDDPLRFEVYPPAPAGQVLICKVVQVPPEYTDAQDTGLPATLSDAIADYVVAKAESRDAEHVLSARAKQFFDMFASKIGG